MQKALLVVESDPQFAGSMDLFFTSRGFDTAVAASARDARRQVIENRPDAIVIGHRDGIVDAADLTPELRALLAPREPPIARRFRRSAIRW
jgi:DNA-binding response OmpR family regulator